MLWTRVAPSHEGRSNCLLAGLGSPGGPDRWRVICVSAGGRHSVCLALPDNSQQLVPGKQRSAPARQRPVPPLPPRVPQAESPVPAPAVTFSGEYDGDGGGLRGEAEEDEDELSPDKVSGKRAAPLTAPPPLCPGFTRTYYSKHNLCSTV